MKTNFKNYIILDGRNTKIVLAEDIKKVRSSFPEKVVEYSGPLTKNELFLGISRIKGKELAEGIFENRLYL